MARFQNLRWIPMIVRAYTEARVRTDEDYAKPSSARSTGLRKQEPTVSSMPPVPNTSDYSYQTNTGTRRKTTVHKHLRSSTHLQQRIPSHRMVMRELHLTRAKLNQLDTLHENVAQLQKRVQRLDAMIHRLSGDDHRRDNPRT